MSATTAEARIDIDGHRLSTGESMAVRVAVSAFLTELADHDRRAALGPIADAYEARLRQVERLLLAACQRGRTDAR